MNVHDAVGVNVEGDLDLGNAPGCGGDTGQLELSQELIVPGHFSLALVNLHLDLSLTVSGSGEHLGLLGGDGSVSVDQLGENAAEGLNSQGQGGHVEQQDISDVTSEHSALDGSSHGHGLVRVDRLAWVTAENLLTCVLHLGHPGHASNQDDLSNVRLAHLGVLHGLVAGVHCLLDEIAHDVLELGSGELQVHVLGAGSVHGKVGEVDVSLGGRGELHLSLLRSFPHPLQGHSVLGQVNTLLLLELANKVIQEVIVKVLSSQEGIAVGGLDFKHSLLNLKDGDIKGAAAKVKHSDNLVVTLVHAIGECGGSRLVDHPEHVESGDLPGVLGGLPLGVVEVCGDSDDSVLGGSSQVSLSCLLHLGEGKGSHL